MTFCFVASLLLLFFLVISFGFIHYDQTQQPVSAQVPKQKVTKVTFGPLSKNNSRHLLSGERKRGRHSIPQMLDEKDSWKRATQKKGRRYQEASQKSDNQFFERKPRVPRNLQQFSNRTRDDFIFAKLLQRCYGRAPNHGQGQGQYDQRPQVKCPHGKHWSQGELWKAWSMQSGSCIPKATCHHLIKRIGKCDIIIASSLYPSILPQAHTLVSTPTKINITFPYNPLQPFSGGSDWDVCMDSIDVANGKCLVYSVGVAGDEYKY